jgi:hypothetical protein
VDTSPEQRARDTAFIKKRVDGLPEKQKELLRWVDPSMFQVQDDDDDDDGSIHEYLWVRKESRTREAEGASAVGVVGTVLVCRRGSV